MLLIETEGTLEQFEEETERDQPYCAAEREHQPDRHLSKKQRHDGADQCAFGEAEMIVHQQMDIGNVGFAGDLVEKNPDDDGDIDGEHQAPGIFPHTQIHSAPETANQVRTITRWKLAMQRASNFGRSPRRWAER